MTDLLKVLAGEADEAETIAGYQHMIDTGQAWHLEGFVGRTAMNMIDIGVCMLGEERHRDFWGNVVPSRWDVKPGTKGSPEYVHRLSHGIHRMAGGRFAPCPLATLRRQHELRQGARG